MFIWACLKHPGPMDLKEKHMVGPRSVAVWLLWGCLCWVLLTWVCWVPQLKVLQCECAGVACGGYN